MKILVTGANGQLGHELIQVLGQDNKKQVLAFTRQQVDFCNPQALKAAVIEHAADWIVNCAAYTKVDLAESEPQLAYQVNRDAVQALAEGAKTSGSKVLHISTDFIFDGKTSKPYLEQDSPAPLSIYGDSKWQGEQVLSQILPDSTILRVSWVYGTHGGNFVKTILRLACEREELGIVADQMGSPSWTNDIAKVIDQLLTSNKTGVYHYSNQGIISWHEFASEIVRYASEVGYPIKAKSVQPISTDQYPVAATRPAFSALESSKIRSELNLNEDHWQQSLHAMIDRLPR